MLTSEQTLMYHNQVLNDYSLLIWQNIKKNSVLKLNHRKNIFELAYKDFNKIIITIKYNDRVITLDVYKYDYVKDVRARIYCQEDIPIYKLYTLYFNDELLKSELNLNDYNIRNMSLLEVKTRNPTLIEKSFLFIYFFKLEQYKLFKYFIYQRSLLYL